MEKKYKKDKTIKYIFIWNFNTIFSLKKPKIYINKSTDTSEDLKFARLKYDKIEKGN